MKRSHSLVALAALCLSGSTFILAQHSPAPDRPAEGPLRANPGSGTAPGVHPPAPSDGSRFAPGPPPGSRDEAAPGGRVKTVETVTVPTPAPTSRVSPGPPRITASPAALPATTPTKAAPTAKKRRRTTPRATPPTTPRATPRAS